MKRALGIVLVMALGLLGAWFCLKRRAADAPEGQSVRQLVRDARDAGQEKRLAAVQALGEMRCEEAVDELVRLLPDTRPEIRMALIAALGRIGSAKAAVPLEVLLGEEEWQVRKAAVEALSDIRAAVSVPALGAALQDEHPAVVMAAAAALSRMGEPALRALADAVEGPAAAKRKAELAAARPAPAVAADNAAGRAKPEAKPEARAAGEALAQQLEELRSRHGRVSQAVAYALGRMAEPEAPALLRRMLSDPAPLTRLAAAEALCARPDPRAAESLAPLLKDPDAEVRQGLARALSRLGEAAVPLFLELASEEQKSIRFSAVKFLSATKDPRSLPVLFAAQDDADKGIREMAAAAVAQIPKQQLVALAAQSLREHRSSVRNRALELLAEAKDPASADALAAVLDDKDAALRTTAAEILQSLGDPRGVEAVARMLADPDADRRRLAAELLAGWGDARGADTLLQIVLSTPRHVPEPVINPKTGKPLRPPVSIEAKRTAQTMRLLGRLGDKRVADYAVACLKEGVPGLEDGACEIVARLRDPRAYDLLAAFVVREGIGSQSAVNALGVLGDPRAVGVLADLHRSVDSPEPVVQKNSAGVRVESEGVYRLAHNWLRKSIVEALERIGGDGAVAALIGILDLTPPQNVQHMETLCGAMSALADPQFVKPLIRMLLHDCPEPPEAAMRVLKKMGIKAIPVLIAELKDPSVARHTAISTALAELGAPAVAPLLAALEDPDPMVRHGAAWALGQMGEQRAVEPLLGMLSDGNAEARASAAWALGRLKAARAVEPIVRLASDTQAVARAAAAEALGRLADHRATTPLETLAQDKDPRVAKAASQALRELAGQGAAAHE
jgi:HEAT repeat protein